MPIYKLTNPKWDEDIIIIGCDCGHNEHQIVVSLWPEGEEHTDFYLAPHLRMYDGFFKRLLAAIRYVFGYKSRYGHYGEIILSTEDVKEMFCFFNEHIDNLIETNNRLYNKPL